MWKEAVTMHKFPGSIVINGKSPSLLKAQVVLGSEPMMYIHSTTLPPPPASLRAPSHVQPHSQMER